MKSTEEVIQNDQKQTETLLKFIKEIEERSKKGETESIEKINDLESQLYMQSKDNQRLVNEMNDIKNQLSHKGADVNRLDQELKICSKRIEEEIELKAECSAKITELEYSIKVRRNCILGNHLMFNFRKTEKDLNK